MPTIKLVITDLDNTIYNWVDFYVPSFLAMIHELSHLTKIDEEDIKASFKKIHERYKTTEYAFAIQELDILAEKNRGLTLCEILNKYDSAIKAFRKTRKKTLHLYTGVKETLPELRNQGKRIIALTDTLMFYAVHRIKYLGIEDLYDGIFAPADHGFPYQTNPKDFRFYNEAEKYETKIPIKVEMDPSIRKPNPKILFTIIEKFKVEPRQVVYIGDSLSRDILMAQKCGVHDVLAKYGHDYNKRYYNELLKFTYWTNKEVEEEMKLRAMGVNPTFSISSFPELLSVIQRLEPNVYLESQLK